MTTFNKKRFLTKAALASTLLATTMFVAGTAYALTAEFAGGVANKTSTPGGVLVPPIQSSTYSTILVDGGTAANAGQINATLATNAVELNAAGGIVTAFPYNGFVGVNAITASTAIALNGIFATAAGTITIGAGSGISALGTGVGLSDGVKVSGATVTLNNNGSIFSSINSAVEVAAAANSWAVITNSLVGSLVNGAGAGQATILVNNGGNLTLTDNGGLISTTGATGQNTIDVLSGAFTGGISNNANGTILNTGAAKSAINLSPAAAGATGGITNTFLGTIKATSTAATITATGVLGTTGKMLNNGNIINTGTGSAINIATPIGGFLNDVNGIIQNNNNAAATFNVSGVTNFALENRGIIGNNAVTGNAINLNAGVATAGNVTYTQTSGAVNGNVILANASAASDGNLFFMKGGVIGGNVAASPNTAISNIWDLAGGEITGALTLSAIGDTVNLHGTKVDGSIIGGAANDIVNVTANATTGLPGSFAGYDGGGAGAGLGNQLNVQTSFASNGPINNVNSIQVTGAGTLFTLNGPVTNMNAVGVTAKGFSVGAGATALINNGINGSAGVLNAGTIQVFTPSPSFLSPNGPTITLGGTSTFNNNGGTLEIGSNSILLIDGNAGAPAFTTNTSSVFKPHLSGFGGPNNLDNGQLQVYSLGVSGNVTTMVTLNGTIAPVLDGGFIPNGQKFNILVDDSGNTVANTATVSLNSAMLTLTPSVPFQPLPNLNNQNIIVLTAANASFASFADAEGDGDADDLGIGAALDAFAATLLPVDPTLLPASAPAGTNLALLDLLGALQGLATAEQVEAAINSLGFFGNGALGRVSVSAMDNVFSSTISRIEDLMMAGHQHKKHHKGMSSGDTMDRGGMWVEVLGAHLDQKNDDDFDGYKANAVGVAIGADWAASDCVLLGLAASYTHTNLDGKGDFSQDAKVKSWQGTGYGWFQFTPKWYVDAVIGYAHNEFDTDRDVFGTTTTTDPLTGLATIVPTVLEANASFDGNTWGAQGDLGFIAVNNDAYYLVPFARLRWAHLDGDDATEEGLGDLGLTVSMDDHNEFLGGLGFRIGGRYGSGDVCYVPELSAMIAYDFNHNEDSTSASFIGDPTGAFAFGIEGNTHGRTSFDLGLGLNTHVGKTSIFAIKYNLELRDSFVGNSGFVKYYYVWG